MYGLSEKTIAAIQGVLKAYPGIEKAILYGSRAKGNFCNGSDIDLVLVGEKLTLSDQFKIETDLDDLLLPYKIDLALYHLIDNKDLIEHIDRVGLFFFKNRD
ncbi:nucleotidyltransferase domain-containing protein [Dyadobacter sp. CY107]|uniref:nucleotidyltransferase domain-containing protein n=1 Tax=Dyadobacter fanqingshengii TaxID=2906443 RepID=UPI001F30C7F6|nr:nucleotidyltransferase domain-containing protein [Dyadobacter fanqingshengii]MCF2504806.1 nucleotidyltransferase domain-containing protein [Dyadobacter fanqingshengii]